MSIRLKLTLWYSIVLAATLVAFGFAIYLFVNFNTYREMKDRIRKPSPSGSIRGDLGF